MYFTDMKSLFITYFTSLGRKVSQTTYRNYKPELVLAEDHSHLTVGITDIAS